MLDTGLQKIEQLSRNPITAKAFFEVSIERVAFVNLRTDNRLVKQSPDQLTVDMTQFYDIKPTRENGIAVTL